MMNSELRKKTAERGETCSAKRTHASRKRKAGNGKGTKGRSTKDEKGRSCGIEGVVSLQLSVECLAATRRGARGNFGLRIADCGIGSERIAECGFRIAEWRATVASHQSRFDKVTAVAKAQWPNKPISSQVQGRNWDTMRVASRGVGLVAGLEVERCVCEMAEADVASGALSGEG